MSKEKKKDRKKITISGIISNVTAFIGSRIFTAGLVIFLGVRLLIDPSSAPNKTAWGIGLVMIIAAGAIVIEMIVEKSFNRKNLPSIIEAFLFLALGVLMIIFSAPIGAVLEQVVFISIIINSISNLVCLVDYKDSRRKREERSKKRSEREDKSNVASKVDESIKEDFFKYNGEFINAAHHVKKKADATLWGQIILDVVFIVAALLVLIIGKTASAPIYFIAAIILILSGLNDVVFAIREYRDKKTEETSEDSSEDKGEK